MMQIDQFKRNKPILEPIQNTSTTKQQILRESNINKSSVIKSPVASDKKKQNQNTGGGGSRFGFKNLVFGKKQKQVDPPQEELNFMEDSQLGNENNMLQIKSAANKEIIFNKNITNGLKPKFIIDPEDIVLNQYVPVHKENYIELLNQKPIVASKFIEILKDSTFRRTKQKTSDILSEAQQEKKKEIQVENIEDKLNELTNDIGWFLNKLFYFFQGLLTGLFLMHILLVYLNIGGTDKEKTTNLMSYSKSAVRLNQLFHIVSFMSFFGSVYQYWIYHMYGLCYAIIIYNHEFTAKISKDGSSISNLNRGYSYYKTNYNVFGVLSIIAAILSLVGWIFLLNAGDLDLKLINLDQNLTLATQMQGEDEDEIDEEAQ